MDSSPQSRPARRHECRCVGDSILTQEIKSRRYNALFPLQQRQSLPRASRSPSTLGGAGEASCGCIRPPDAQRGHQSREPTPPDGKEIAQSKSTTLLSPPANIRLLPRNRPRGRRPPHVNCDLASSSNAWTGLKVEMDETGGISVLGDVSGGAGAYFDHCRGCWLLEGGGEGGRGEG